MPEGNGDPTRKETTARTKDTPVSRRRWLQLAGAGALGGLLATGTAAGAGSDLPCTIVFDGTDGSKADYRFGVTGTVEPDGDVGAVERTDSLSGTDVAGVVRSGKDAYQFDGNLKNLDYSGSVRISVRYEQVSESGPDRLEIVTPEDGSVEYTFTSDGEVAKVLDNGKLSAEEGNDDITDNGDGTWTVSGLTGNGYGDTYALSGSVTSFSPAEGAFTLLLDGEEVTVADLTGQSSGGAKERETQPEDDTEQQSTDDGGDDAPSAKGGPIGGGEGYSNTVGKDQATTVVESGDALADALGNASSGDVVYVAGSVEADLGGSTFEVPGGVTLASNRGVGGAPGALLATDSDPDEFFTLGDGGRITGLRIRGPHPGDDQGGDSGSDGVSARGGAEVDNCDIWGFSHAGVKTGSGGDAHIHHNVIRECNKSGLGYGVSAQSGHPVVEYNYFNFNRHSVASDGGHHGYTCRYNHFGPKTVDHIIDVHEPGGVRLEVNNNVVEAVETTGGEQTDSVAIRGTPDEVATIHDNWFFNPDEPRDSPSGWSDEAIIQPTVDEWTNVSYENNYYGENASVSYADVIPGYDGSR